MHIVSVSCYYRYMKYFCGHTEAFFYAYRNGREAYDAARVANVTQLEDCLSHLNAVTMVDLAAADIRPPAALEPGSLCNVGADVGKHHVLVSGKANRHESDIVVRHRWNTPIPHGGLYLIGSGIYMSSPEFIYLQLAGMLSDVQLALVGCWMCSEYRIVPSSSDEQAATGKKDKLLSVKPLTTPERLETFLNAAKGSYGLMRARRVLKLVAAGSESPTETDMYALTCFPRSLGGQGAPKATLNHLIEVKPEDAKIVDRQDRTSWRIDMCWPELRKGVEYLGKDHETTASEDRERMNALISKRYTILQYEYKHLVSVKGRARRIEQIRRLLGMGTHNATPKEIRAAEVLEEELFGAARFRL